MALLEIQNCFYLASLKMGKFRVVLYSLDLEAEF